MQKLTDDRLTTTPKNDFEDLNTHKKIEEDR